MIAPVKLHEKILKPWLEQTIQNSGEIHEKQHGFRPEKSTLQEVESASEK